MTDRIVRRRGVLTRDDLKVWAHVTRGIEPMQGRAPLIFEDEMEAAARAPVLPVQTTPTTPALKKSAVPPLGPLERKTRRRLSRGQRSIDGVIDLHGLRQHEAHAALIGFIYRAQGKGSGIVLVITGKGSLGAGEERGVLRRMVPHWLADPALRRCIIGFEPASRDHGGEGSLYVMIRKPRT